MEINDRGNSNKIALYSRKQVKAIEAFVEFYNHERNNDALDNIIAVDGYFKRIE